MLALDDYFAENPVSVETEDRYRRALGDVLGEGDDLGLMSAVELRKRLFARSWGSSSRWVALCACKRFLRWRFGGEHPALRLRLRRDDPAPQRFLDQEQAINLLASFDKSEKDIRDLAMASLFLDSGLRVSEMCRLELGYVDLRKGRLQVLVKGGQWAFGVFSRQTACHLDNWLSIRRARSGVQNVFVSIGGERRGTAMCRSGLQLTVRRWGERIGLRLSPHDLRRSFAVISTQLGVPSRVLQIAGRWSSLAMVERYTAGVTMSEFVRYSPVAGLLNVEQGVEGSRPFTHPSLEKR